MEQSDHTEQQLEMVSDTPRTDDLMLNGCIAINILEHARTLERELNNTTPPAPSPVWPEIVRLQGIIASLTRELEAANKSLKNYTNAIESL